jgi:hypothetical protein
MKLLISTIFVIFSLTNKLTAQNTSDQKNSMHTWLALPMLVSTSSADNDGLLYNPRFGIGKGKSMFYLGPTFSSSNGFTGGNFVYQIYPNGLGRTFDLFFQGDLIIQKSTYNQRASLYPYTYPYWIDTKVTETEWGIYIGYGFNLNITKNLFFTTKVSLGANNHKRLVDFLGAYPTNSDVGYDGEFGGEVNFGLGIKFGK